MRVLMVTLVLALLGLPRFAFSAERMALVIGNASYENAEVLRNPLNDAKGVANSLRKIGFEVTLGTDLNFSAMRLNFLRFLRSAKDAEIVLFYFAGHGIQVNGQNFLLPVDAEINSEIDA